MHGERNVGGGEYSLYFLISRLRRDIFEPIVFYASENEIIERLRADGIRLVNIPLNKKITSVYRDEIKKKPANLFVYVYYMISGIFKVLRPVREFQIDILHPHDNLSKIIGGIAGKIAGIRVVAHCRDLLRETLIEKILIFYQLLVMDRIIAVSESNKSIFGKKALGKVVTIYNGIDIEVFDRVKAGDLRERLGLKGGTVVIGIIGVFDKCKGHIYLFQAIERLVSDGIKNVLCLVVGDGRERNVLKGLVDNQRLGDYFRFLGYRNDVPELLLAMDVVVVPSVQESFPRVALEAMAANVPVIATNVGGLPEAVEDGRTGIIVPPTDVDALASSIRYLVENPHIRKNMGDAGRRRVEEKFSLESNIRSTEALYLDVLKQGTAQ